MALRRNLRKLAPAWLSDKIRMRRLEQRHASRWGDPAVQSLLIAQYRGMANRGETYENLNDAGFQVFSASDEDGILLYLFAMLGTTNRTFVDLGAAAIEGSNTANLVVSHGWYGLHIELHSDALAFAQRFYRSRARSRILPPKAVCATITAENVNSIIRQNGVSGEIDFLSIDIDGNDYWVWNAISVIRPRVVEIEIQPALGLECKTIPYDAGFDRDSYSVNCPPFDIVYCGGSLSAMNKLAVGKGYTFVGCDSHRVNAFFVRDDVNDGRFPAADIALTLDHPRVHDLLARYRDTLATMPWETV